MYLTLFSDVLSSSNIHDETITVLRFEYTITDITRFWKSI